MRAFKSKGAWAILAGSVLVAASVHAQTLKDGFETYANGSGIGGQGNGQITWTSTLIDVDGDTANVTSADAFEGTKSLQVDDPSTQTSVFRAKPAAGPVFLGVGDSLPISFYVKGVGSREGFAFRPFYASDALGTGESNISNSYQAGLSSGGFYFLNNGNLLGANKFDADKWYLIDYVISKSSATQYSFSLNMTDTTTNTPLGILNHGPVADGGRPFFTGLEFRTTSESHVARIDGLQIIAPVPEPGTSALAVAATALILARRRSKPTPGSLD